MFLLKLLFKSLLKLSSIFLLVLVHVIISIFLYFNYGIFITALYQLCAYFIYLVFIERITFIKNFFTEVGESQRQWSMFREIKSKKLRSEGEFISLLFAIIWFLPFEYALTLKTNELPDWIIYTLPVSGIGSVISAWLLCGHFEHLDRKLKNRNKITEKKL